MDSVLTKIAQKGLSGIEYLEKVAPQVVEEYLRWELMSTVISLSILVFICIILISIFIKAYRAPKDLSIVHKPRREEWAINTMITSAVLYIISLIPIICHGFNLLQLIYAPRIYILENFMDLINR